MKYYIYILECADNTLYVGATSDINKRLHAHNHLKSGAHYTKIRRPVSLKYFEELKTFSKMRAREAEIKRMTKAEKTILIVDNKKNKK